MPTVATSLYFTAVPESDSLPCTWSSAPLLLSDVRPINVTPPWSTINLCVEALSSTSNAALEPACHAASKVPLCFKLMFDPDEACSLRIRFPVVTDELLRPSICTEDRP